MNNLPNNLKIALTQSQVRTQNLRDAILLGLIGNTHEEVMKNIKAFNEYHEEECDKECEAINEFLRRKL